MSALKRFLLFEGIEYDEGGGWNDFKGSYHTPEDALADRMDATVRPNPWWQVVDIELGLVVFEGDRREERKRRE